MRSLFAAVLLSLALSSAEVLSLLTVSPVRALPRTDVIDNNVSFEFPETATFSATLTAQADIVSVVLEYGNKQQTCGEVIAKAYPEFTSGTTVNVAWTWEMRQSGSLPPGAQLWWRWRVTDINGNETVTETKNATWLDGIHNWKTISEGNINLHWYRGNNAFAQDLMNAAQNGIEFNKTQSGLTTDDLIDLYIYANVNDMREAMLYEPSWTGGLAYPDYNIVVIGIAPDELEFGRDTIVHELTHVLIGGLTFSCLGSVPTWLDEGLAMFSEGELTPDWQELLDDAIENNSLQSVRSMGAGFSEDSYLAILSYGQSYSVVKFMIETYGQAKMTTLLTLLRDGNTIDDALQQVYGFDTDGLEDQWRLAVGAQPRTVSAQPTVQPTPTFVPTIVPVSGGSFNLQSTATPIPTSSSGAFPTETSPSTGNGARLAFTLMLAALCCAILLVIGVVVLGFVVRSQNRKGGNNVQQ